MTKQVSDKGNDINVGDKGNDKINAGQSDDVLDGGDADKFQCGSGDDDVTDFDESEGDKATGNCEGVEKGNSKKQQDSSFSNILFLVLISNISCSTVAGSTFAEVIEYGSKPQLLVRVS